MKNSKGLEGSLMVIFFKLGFMNALKKRGGIPLQMIYGLGELKPKMTWSMKIIIGLKFERGPHHFSSNPVHP